MFCTNCGNQVADTALFCTSCGAKLADAPEEEKVETPAEETADISVEQKYDAPQQEPEQSSTQQAHQSVTVNVQAQPKTEADTFRQRPALQLPTERGLLKMLFLGLITLGIYNMVVMVRISEEINITASRYDGQRTMHYFFVTLLAPLTLCIYPIVWMHNLCNRLGVEVRRRNYDYRFSATTMWLWGVLGSLILIGPFIYVYKFMKTVNLINKSYNYYG